METQNASFSDIISNFIIYFLLGVLGYIIWGLIFGEWSSRKTSNALRDDYVPGGNIMKDSEVSARDKACVAVGLCYPRSTVKNKVVSTDQVNKWKNTIMDNAESIFGKDKSEKSKKKSKRKK